MAITDYPEADKYANRSTAKLLKIFGAVMFFLGAPAMSSISMGHGAMALAISALMFWAASSLKLQALTWTVEELEKKSAEVS